MFPLNYSIIGSYSHSLVSVLGFEPRLLQAFQSLAAPQAAVLAEAAAVPPERNRNFSASDAVLGAIKTLENHQKALKPQALKPCPASDGFSGF